jgi:lipopolysaccharide/colanic/teichoic acid biosynthesis glycosyltransferase
MEPFALPAYFRWKGWLDQALALLLLIPGLPLIGLLVVLVRLSSPGPGIFRQVRVGRNGKLFTMFKLRSMRCDAETGTGAVWAQPGDARVTRIGSILRKLHLDELPQLFNVLRGEMSLIGPRPERPEFVIVLEKKIPGYRHRLTVLPGITGLAQINLPPDTDLDGVRKKQQLDLEYIQTANLLLDLRMLVSTFLRMLGMRGSLAMRVMRLRRDVKTSAIGVGALDTPHLVTPDQIASAATCDGVRYDGKESGGAKRPEVCVRLPR